MKLVAFNICVLMFVLSGCRLVPLKAKPSQHPDLEVEKKNLKKKPKGYIPEKEQLRLRRLEGTQKNS